MKILHTSDWHIGKVLHKQPLHDELKMFFEWLIDIIEKEKIEVVLVSGDIFDRANPSARDRKLYYHILKRLVNKKIRIIITGGNHDSAGFLNAPKELLHQLEITVIGGATDPIENELIEIEDKKGNLIAIIAAVPFLRDKDLRNSQTDSQYKNRTEAIREGIKDHYKKLGEICTKKYNNIPKIAMGHLYIAGSQLSDSERDIHIGNTAALDTTSFPTCFDYIALGHIHKPQRISKSDYIRYSGSPIGLSFSEKKDDKCVIIFDIVNNKVDQPHKHVIPKFRELKKITGNLEKVISKLKNYNPLFPLPSFIEIEVNEDEYSSVILSEVDELQSSFEENTNFKILKRRTNFKSGIKNTADLFNTGENIEDLTPIEVFSKRLEIETLDKDKIDMLKAAFQEILETVQQKEEA